MEETQAIEWRGRSGIARWRLGLTPAGAVTQVSGVCFKDDQSIVLVSQDGQQWGLPGGKPETGESWLDTLRRELLEEACAEILDSRFLGTQQIEGLTDEPYHQLRFYVRVRLSPFQGKFETKFRRTLTPEEFTETLNWGPGAIAGAILQAALRCRES